MQDSHQKFHQQRISENDQSSGLRVRNDFRHINSSSQNRKGKNEPHQRPRKSHVEEGFAIQNRRANANESAEGADKRWRRQEIRIAGIDVVIVAGKIVSEFVRQQNANERKGKRNAGQQEMRVGQRTPGGRKRIFNTGKRRAVLRIGHRELSSDGQS